MTHDPAWHAEYLRLENAHEAAREAFRRADRALNSKRPHASAQMAYDIALENFRAASAARFNFEMAATVIVDAAA